MRIDQIERLQTLTEDLAEVVIEELDPKAWPGAGKPLAEVTKAERGDRYWCKKNAAASMTLLVKVVNLTDSLGRGKKPADAPDEGDELEQEIARAEREATELLERLKREKGGDVRH